MRATAGSEACSDDVESSDTPSRRDLFSGATPISGIPSVRQSFLDRVVPVGLAVCAAGLFGVVVSCALAEIPLGVWKIGIFAGLSGAAGALAMVATALWWNRRQVSRAGR